MVIYIESVFAFNVLVDYLLLFGAARVAGRTVARRRLLLGAAVGGIYAAVQLFLPKSVVLLLLGLALMGAAAYRGSGRAVKLTLLFFLTGIRLFFVSQGIILVLSLALCGLLLLIIATDFEQYCIFNDMIIPLAAGGVLCCALFLPIAIDHLISAAAGGVLFLIIAILSRGALGGGDIKLIACLGLWMGTKTLFFIGMFGILSVSYTHLTLPTNSRV